MTLQLIITLLSYLYNLTRRNVVVLLTHGPTGSQRSLLWPGGSTAKIFSCASFFTMPGIIMLFGVVTKNAILNDSDSIDGGLIKKILKRTIHNQQHVTDLNGVALFLNSFGFEINK